jgi:hypothetical protein
MVTVCGDVAPAVIWGGENEQVAPAGSPEHALNVTLLVKLAPLPVATDIVVEVDCPGFAAAGAVRVAGTVKV